MLLRLRRSKEFVVLVSYTGSLRILPKQENREVVDNDEIRKHINFLISYTKSRIDYWKTLIEARKNYIAQVGYLNEYRSFEEGGLYYLENLLHKLNELEDNASERS
jgi:hypothetical protein